MIRARLRHLNAAMMRSAVFPGRYKLYRLLSKILGEEPLPFAVPLPGGANLPSTVPSGSKCFTSGTTSMKFDLRDHPKAANEGHLKTGQR